MLGVRGSRKEDVCGGEALSAPARKEKGRRNGYEYRVLTGEGAVTVVRGYETVTDAYVTDRETR